MFLLQFKSLTSIRKDVPSSFFEITACIQDSPQGINTDFVKVNSVVLTTKFFRIIATKRVFCLTTDRTSLSLNCNDSAMHDVAAGEQNVGVQTTLGALIIRWLRMHLESIESSVLMYCLPAQSPQRLSDNDNPADRVA